MRFHSTAAQRGFTIAELLIVISIIGIMVASAAPSFIQWMKDRRVTDSAQNIADLYRTARARAMGRGSAMAVRWNETAAMPTDAAPWGQFALIEGIVGASPSPLDQQVGMSSCLTPDFASAPNTNTDVITGHEPRREKYDPAEARFLDWDDQQLAWAAVCYTPRGRVWFQDAPGSAMGPMAGVPRVEIENMDDGMRRQVILPPTGAARLVLRVQ